MLCALLRQAVERKEPASTCCCTARPAPARPSWPRWRAGAGLELFEVEYADRDGNSLSGRDRYRSLQIAQVFLKGSAAGGAAVRRGGGRVPAHLQREAAQPDGARRAGVAPRVNGSVSGKAWVNQILESNAVPTIWSPTASSRSTRPSAAALPTTWS